MSKRTPKRASAPRAKPDPLAGYLSQALSLHQQGRLDEAERVYDFILNKQPQHFDAHHYKGVVMLQRGQAELGVTLIEVALKSAPNAPDAPRALSNLANGLMRLERHAEALACLDRSLAKDPRQPDALTNRGLALAALGRFGEAFEAHTRALQMRPDFVEAVVNLGNALRALRRFDEALAACDKALSLRPSYPEAHNNRGLAMVALRRFDEALASYDAAIASRPHYAEAYNNRGNALKELGRFDEAFASYDKALALKPGYAEALYNRGNTLGALNRHNEAIAAYDAALALQASHVDANWNKGLAHLLLGQLPQGWPQYEWRWKLKDTDPPRTFDCPPWRGDEALQGKRIVLWAEQGLGDTLQFCRYAPLLAARGAEVILEVQAPLTSLLAPLADAVITRGTVPPPADFHCPLLSLPSRLGTTLETVPNASPYLRAAPDKLAPWQQRIATHGPGFRVGLCCSGNPGLANDRNRSIALAKFAPLLESGQRHNVHFFLMQKECRPDDEAFLKERSDIHDLRAELQDFGDTAAVLQQLDLLISVDTSVVHLAGALGTRAWLLLPRVPDWRWLLDRDDSPWYPSLQLYRQTVAGDWDSVLTRAQADLAALLSQHSA